MSELYRFSKAMTTSIGYSFYRYVGCNSQEYSHLDTTWYYPFAYTLSGITAFFVLKGIVLNIICFIILGKDRTDSVMSGILRFVAVSDILTLIVNSIDSFCHIIESHINNSTEIQTSLGYIHSINWIFKASFVAVRNWSMAYLAISRCIYILYPMKASSIITISKSYKLLLTCTIVIGIINIPKVFETAVNISVCTNRTYQSIGSSAYMPLWYTMTTSVISNSLLPLVATVIANILLLRKWYFSISKRKNLSMVKSKSSDSNIQQNASVIKTVLMLSSLFVICQAPMLSYGFIVLSRQPAILFNILNLVGLLVSDIDSSCNFWIYVTSNPKFVSLLITTIPCLCCFSKSVVYRTQSRFVPIGKPTYSSQSVA